MGISAHLERADLCQSQIEEVEGMNVRLKVVTLEGLAGGKEELGGSSSNENSPM